MSERQTPTCQSLELDRFPLHGRRLIEASAGTGKTFTIASLYLRLLLGHGPAGSAHSEALTVEQILVVTFTEAATAELRQRIRQRITQARLAFARQTTEDDFIAMLLAEVSDHERAFRLLDRAQKQMDEAAVFTIHGFCARMLKENAFESGSLFEAELLQEVRPYQEQAARDFWRRQLQGISKPLAAWVRALYSGPDKLVASLQSAISRPELKIVPTSVRPLAELIDELQTGIEQLHTAWLNGRTDILTVLDKTVFNGNKVRAATLAKHLLAMEVFIKTGVLEPGALLYLNSEFLQARLKKGAEWIGHPALDRATELALGYQQLKQALPVAALAEIRQRVAEAKEQRGELGFDDLLVRLDTALQASCDNSLSDHIAQQYRVAMIDEFQDTDPVQYRVFDQIYRDQADTALLMIGDPKQAIYAFRGADINTYLQARTSTEDHYNLDTNWRSASDLIEAVNGLFQRKEHPFLESEIPFLPVKAAGLADKEALTISGKTAAPLQFWPYRESRKKEDYQLYQATTCASQINQLLQQAARGEALLGDVPVQAGDLAVLVRTGREAELIRQQLAAQGVRSVYLSNRDNVFASTEARELRLLLQAALTPRDERKVRAVFASALFALPLVELDRLNEDELALEKALEQAAHWQTLWRRQGVRPMLRRLLVERGIATRLLREPLGERRLTDLLHLGELLQEAAQHQRSDHGLVRWLHEQIEQGGAVEGAQLRLESDSALVKVVTIHKSKGLEYPLVWLPFAMGGRKASEAIYHQEGALVLDLSGEKAAKLAADDERLAEDLRLLYVALTRARHACFVGIYPGAETGKGMKLSDCALGVLLEGDEKIDFEQALSDCGVSPVLAVQTPAPVALSPWQEPVETQALQARRFNGAIERNWTIASYSRLVQGRHGGWLQPGVDLEVLSASESQSDDTDRLTPFSFPRGARYGTFLHNLFEQLDFTQPDGAWIEEQCQAQQLDSCWTPVVQEWVTQILATDLNGSGLRMADLSASQKWVELEFLLPLKAVDAQALNDLLGDRLENAKLPALTFERLQGMLTGFIDLTFSYQGRYYLLDYKSNHLGSTWADYQPEALNGAMAEHRYDLQALLYTLALHRLLRQRLPDYDYEQHIGGAFYLFLRGLNGTDAEQGVWFNRPEKALIEQLETLLLEPVAEVDRG